MSVLTNTRVTLEMIKWEHSIFALPFALTAAVLAAAGWPTPWQLVWIILCMVTARTAGMAFNRWADASFDAANPRTATRAIPAGTLSRSFVAAFTLLAAALFLLCAAQLNRLTFELAPIALALILSYSYTKRFTQLSHLVLGLVLGSAPSAAWIAVRGSLDPRILVVTAIVMCWVAGFDVLYGCQDAAHDRAVGLKSIPALIGIPGAFWFARVLHLTMFALCLWLIPLFHLGLIAWIGIGLVAALLCYEHAIISPTDLRRMNAAFFTLNGVISIIFFVFVAADVLHRR